MKNVTPTIAVMKVNACKNSSTYFGSYSYVDGGYNFFNDGDVTVTYSKQTDNEILILLQYNRHVSETSETHVVVELNALTVNFS